MKGTLRPEGPVPQFASVADRRYLPRARCGSFRLSRLFGRGTACRARTRQKQSRAIHRNRTPGFCLQVSTGEKCSDGAKLFAGTAPRAPTVRPLASHTFNAATVFPTPQPAPLHAPLRTRAVRSRRDRADSPIHLPLLRPAENIVDQAQRLRLNRSLSLSHPPQTQSDSSRSSARSHDRSPNRVAVQRQSKDRHRKISRRRSIQTARSAAPQRSHRLLEHDGGNSRHPHAMRSANLFLDFLGGSCVKASIVISAPSFFAPAPCSPGQDPLLPHEGPCLCILNRNVSQSARSGNHHPLSGTCHRLLESFVGRHPRAQNRRRIHERKALRNASKIIGLHPRAYSPKLPFTEYPEFFCSRHSVPSPPGKTHNVRTRYAATRSPRDRLPSNASPLRPKPPQSRLPHDRE